jgi:phospholipid transport system substrate-binding protein
MKKYFLVFVMLFCSSILPAQASNSIAPPDELIRSTVHDVLEIINKDNRAQDENQKKLLEFIDAKVLPHFDFERMTRLAVGRSWRAATPEQRNALIAEFRTMLVRTYTRAFTLYKEVSVETKPVKVPENADEVTVKTVILRPGAQPVPVNYEMEKTDAGWKAFDVTVEGVSLVATHRNSFAEKVQQDGIDGLIKSLAELNRSASNTKTGKADAK